MFHNNIAQLALLLFYIWHEIVPQINSEKSVITIRRKPGIGCINWKGRQLKELNRTSHLGNVVTIKGKIRNKINGRIKKSKFDYLVKGLLRNKDSNKNCELGIF